MTAFFLAASDAEELSGSVTDPALLPSSSSHNARLRADEELIRIMTKPVNELGLEWSPLRSHLAAGCTSVFSRGTIKPPTNARPPSFPKFIRAHDIVTHPHSSRIRSSASAALTSVDGAEEKGYEHLPPGGVCGRTSLPAHSYRMEGEVKPSVQAVQSHICTRWTCLLGGWTSGFSATLYGCAPGLPGQDARQWGSRSECSFTQGPEEGNRPGSTHHQSHRPSHRPFDVQSDSIRAPPLAHDDGDERGRQSSLPRRSGFIRQPVWSSCGGLCWALHGGSEVISSDATLPP